MALSLVISVAVFATAILSGVFGMAGGMLLMAVYLALFSVAGAMVLHGITQLAANGFRAALLWRHVHWPSLRWVALGMVAAIVVFAAAQIVLARATIMVVLGAIPLLAMVVPWSPPGGIERPPLGVLCGAVSTGAQLTAGVAGPVIDYFFIVTSLNRYQIIATKALIQSAGHLVKALYFGAFLTSRGEAISPWIYLLAVSWAVVGTGVGRAILDRISERTFRRGSRGIVAILGLLLLGGGLIELWRGWSGARKCASAPDLHQAYKLGVTPISRRR